MTVKTVKASDIEACPLRSLDASHFIRQYDGSILCMCAIEAAVRTTIDNPRSPDETFAVLHRGAPPDELRVDAGDGIDLARPRCWYRCTFCFDTAHGCTYEAITSRVHDDGIDVECCEMHRTRGGQLHDLALQEFIRLRGTRCTCYRWDDCPNPLCRVHGLDEVVDGRYDSNPQVAQRVDWAMRFEVES